MLNRIGANAARAIQFVRDHRTEVQTGCILFASTVAIAAAVYLKPGMLLSLGVTIGLGIIAIPRILKSIRQSRELEARIAHRLSIRNADDLRADTSPVA